VHGTIAWVEEGLHGIALSLNLLALDFAALALQQQDSRGRVPNVIHSVILVIFVDTLVSTAALHSCPNGRSAWDFRRDRVPVDLSGSIRCISLSQLHGSDPA
jgi:hypothetical protein